MSAKFSAGGSVGHHEDPAAKHGPGGGGGRKEQDADYGRSETQEHVRAPDLPGETRFTGMWGPKEQEVQFSGGKPDIAGSEAFTGQRTDYGKQQDKGGAEGKILTGSQELGKGKTAGEQHEGLGEQYDQMRLTGQQKKVAQTQSKASQQTEQTEAKGASYQQKLAS